MSRKQNTKPRSMVSGTQRMREAGKVGFSLALTPEQKEIFTRAAFLDGRSVTQFLIWHGLRASEKIISRNA